MRSLTVGILACLLIAAPVATAGFDLSNPLSAIEPKTEAALETAEQLLALEVPELLPDAAQDLLAGSGGDDEGGTGGPEPTSMGQAIVAFQTGFFPGVQPGDELAGFRVLTVFPEYGFLVVQAADVRDVRDAMRDLSGLVYVEDDLPLSASVTPNDTRYSSQYGPPQMKVNDAWGMAPGYGSSSIKVAVVDTGIYRTHEDFTPASRFLAGKDYIDGDTDPADDCGHGTHVTGTVAATTNNAKGVAGMSQATIIPVRVLQAVGGLLNVQCTGSTSNVAAGMQWAADQGARVISMSIGGGASTTLANAVTYSWNKGSILVAAAGNDGASNSIDYPGAYPNVVAVGATTSTKAKASFSDMGPQLDIMAPGDTIWSTTYSSTTSYGTMSGTSMATPHVSGVLALALSCAPATTNSQAVNALLATAENLGAAGRDDTYGWGLARADLLVQNLCGGGGGNLAPTASFTHSEAGLATSVNGAGSSDADGSIVSYAWTFGDGATATGVSASRTYAAAGTYTVTLTVTDNGGATGVASQSVTVTTGGGGDPDPGTPNLASGVQVTTTNGAVGTWKYWKIQVPAGKSSLSVVLDGPNCTNFGLTCQVDLDLYTRQGAKPTSATYACSPQESDADETCTHASPAADWWYVGVYVYGGSASQTYKLKATYT